jgi:hypothetical protein
MGRTKDLSRIRAAFGLSQRQLAHALNVAPFTVARWESGANKPTGLAEVVVGALRSVADTATPAHARKAGGRVALGIGHVLVEALQVGRKDRRP